MLGVPLDLGSENLGVDIGPDAFRQKQIVEKLQQAGLNVEDRGDIACTNRSELEPGDPLLPYADEIVRTTNELAKVTEQAVKDQEVVVALGGDHSINLGVVAGASTALDGNIGMIYIDAHGDMNTAEASKSHNIHGMHLAALMGFGDPKLTHSYTEKVKLNKDNLLHIAGSDLDEFEVELMKDENLANFSMFDLLSKGLAPLLEMIDDLAQRVPNIWVSVDLDAIDSVYAPGVGIPNHGGLTYREIAAITEYIGKKCNVIGVDIVEYNPLKDSESITAELGIEITAKLLGTNYSWYTNYMARQ